MNKKKVIKVCLGSFVLIGALLVSLLAVPMAQAGEGVDPTLDWVQGIWTAVSGGGGTVTGVGTNEVRWGIDSGYGKSGLRFDGAGSQAFDVGEQFLLGTFTHLNYPVFAPSADGATLKLTLHFSDPVITPDPTFTYNFDIEETPNELPFPPWQQSGTPCDDRITFPTVLGEESFLIGDKLYTLKIVGFVDVYPNGTPVSEFITEERKSSTAYLVGELSSVLVPYPEITLVAKEVSADGTTWYDADVSPGPNIPVGAAVYWRYIVQNTGNVALTDITVTDDKIGTVCSGITLNPGDSTTCTGTGVAIAGQYGNIGTVTGYYEATAYTDSDPSHYYGLAPPIADANGPYQGDEGKAIVFDGSGSSDPDGTIVSYEWDLDGDGTYETTGATPSKTWGDDYTGTIGLRVTDDMGATDTDTTTVTVLNVAPTVEAGPDQTVTAGDTVSFSGSFTDPGWLDTHTATWDFGDGTVSVGGIVTEEHIPPDSTGTVTGTHIYTAGGAYTVTLTVTDDDGGIGSNMMQVFVRSITKTLSPTSGDLGDVVHVTLTVYIPPGETVGLLDTLPLGLHYIMGSFEVDGSSATPTIDKNEISYTITVSGTHTVEFDVKVDEAKSWEDMEVCNVATATWYNEAGEVIETKEDVECFIIHAFEQLHKNVGIPKADVVFAIDLTGSMSDEIAQVKANATNIMNSLAAQIADVQFGLISFMDYDGYYTTYSTSTGTWYNATYGGAAWGDYPYKLDQDITNNIAVMTAQINGLTLGFGADGPQDYTRIVHESYNDANLHWRTDAKRILILFGDNVPHDTNFDNNNDGTPDNTGGDPGRDTILGTADDLDFETEVANAAANGVHIMAVYSGWTGSKYPWTYMATQTGGGYFELEEAEEIPDAIKDLIKSQALETLTIKEKTDVQWALVIDIINPFSYTMTDVVITDRFGAEIEIDEIVSYTHGTVTFMTRGKSEKVFLTWEIGDILPGETARLILLVSTDLNPKGHQEYSEPGIYELNSGATLKFIDPEDVQLSAYTDSIYVTVLPLED